MSIRLRQPGHTYSLPEPDEIWAERRRQQVAAESSSTSQEPQKIVPKVLLSVPCSQPGTSNPQNPSKAESTENSTLTQDTALVFKQLRIRQESIDGHNSDDASVSKISAPNEPDYDLMDTLQTGAATSRNDSHDIREHEIKYASIISRAILDKSGSRHLPQYGYFGDLNGGTSRASRLFVNTNNPFSAIICGVQGSGKSHTTSCLLENALIPSRLLGRLQEPLSALVFSYGDYGSGGAGFTVSEAAFLASRSRDPGLQDHPAVKKITVLTSPTNPEIRDIYNRLENVTAIPFKLKLHALDAGTMNTLMAFDESNTVPLYMAQVQKIIRDLAIERKFSYFEFKRRLKLCLFNPTQKNMLGLRLGLLESFLDLEDIYPPATFEPGEITIMDLSCPFVDTNTACILFNLGLKQYIQSSSAGKMIVLDEAHKYMQNLPGAKQLTDHLKTIIRQQRHSGARVIVSTQEPLLLSDIIALASITVMHRFSSPEWFAVLKRHIPMIVVGNKDDGLARGHMNDKGDEGNDSDGLGAKEHMPLSKNYDHDYNHTHDDILLRQKIERLRTGEALVYAAGAVLDVLEDGELVKGTGRLLEVNIRKRVTADGGRSILSVD
ncbi:P-loop containing nucleoside triphosphate hydrolase protein [Rutstroemia sp. NJR-2017a WRK4]|nr:P-loop containing nucleoside triphosphate hydrolase protein [Rutstroemia sp. NJR-2017a WRK4]